MSDKLETLAAILGLTGLVVAIPLAYWAWVDKRPQGPDVGVAVFVEDQTPDEPVVPEPTVCPQCDGELWVIHTVRGYTVEVPCDQCWCTCGRRATNGLCSECKEETWPTPKTPPAPTTSPRTRDEPTATQTPQTPAASATQPEGTGHGA